MSSAEKGRSMAKEIIKHKMKYIQEGTRGLHRAEIAELLASAGIQVDEPKRFPKRALTAMLSSLCEVSRLE